MIALTSLRAKVHHNVPKPNQTWSIVNHYLKKNKTKINEKYLFFNFYYNFYLDWLIYLTIKV